MKQISNETDFKIARLQGAKKRIVSLSEAKDLCILLAALEFLEP